MCLWFPARPAVVGAAGWSPASVQMEDVWWLRSLYSIYAPQPVQHAEGMSDDGQASLPLAWWELTHQHGFVVHDKATSLAVFSSSMAVAATGCCCTATRRRRADGRCCGTAWRMAGNRWPVYCAVRDYQGGLAAVLYDHGFQSLTRRSRLVKHLAVRVKAAEPVTVRRILSWNVQASELSTPDISLACHKDA